jgi:acyl phosphate:glycerol-3-phosphate acyltransferase
MMSDLALPALVLALSYLLGSIPFGLLLTRAAGLGDVRAIGSGNIGATNVLRTGNKGIAAATLLLDAGKGIAAVLAVRLLLPGADLRLELLAAAGALIGHLYPVWLGFRGGKGVATFLGIAFALWWPIGLAAALVWLAALALIRISSVGGLAAAASAPLTAALSGRTDLAIFFAGVALLVAWMHRANIGRLLAGTEPRIGAAKNQAPQSQ